MINKLTKVARYAVAAALIFTMVMSPLASHAAPVGTIGGTLVIEPGSSLPVPDVAIASDGRSLVVYHDGLSILGSIVSADGVTVGQPFSISNGMLVEEYGGAPSVIWNEDQSEWLVVFTSDRSGYRHVYAQRVSTSGELAGNVVILPKDRATKFGERGGTIYQIGDPTNDVLRTSAVNVSATWSSEHQVYLVAWHASTSRDFSFPRNLGLDTDTRSSGFFGYFMTPNLRSADGIDASFVLQDTRDIAAADLSNQEYSPELDQWAFVWADENYDAGTRMTRLTFEGTTEEGPVSFVVSNSAEVVDPVGLGYFSWRLPDDIVWVNTLNSWVVSWAARPLDGGPWNGFARVIAADGTLGAPVQVSNFDRTSRNIEISQMQRQSLAYDSIAGVIYASAGFYDGTFGNPSSALWRFSATNLAPIGWQEIISPETSLESPSSLNQSMDPKISASNGNIALVYESKPTGVSSQVRFHLIASANTPPVSSPSPTPAPPLAYSGPVIFSGQSAAAGAEVTLTGEKLETVTSAMVGDVPVKLVSALAQSLTLEIPTSLAAGTHDLVLQSSYGKLTVMDGLKVVAAVVTESPVTVEADTAALVKKLSVGSFRGRIVIYSKGHEGSRLSVKVAGKWLVVPELSETWNNTDYSRTTRLVGGGRLLRLDLFIDGRFVRTQEVLTK